MIEFIAKLENIGIRQHFNDGNILFYEGEIARNFFLLLRGRVRVYKSPAPGKEITINSFTPPSLIAEMPAFAQSTYPASAICEGECELLILEFTKFKALCEADVGFALMMMGSLFEKIKILEKQISQGAVPLKTRLIRYLLDNEQNLSQISQREIATALNVRAESLSRTIKELKNDALIDTKKGKIQLLKREILLENL